MNGWFFCFCLFFSFCGNFSFTLWHVYGWMVNGKSPSIRVAKYWLESQSQHSFIFLCTLFENVVIFLINRARKEDKSEWKQFFSDQNILGNKLKRFSGTGVWLSNEDTCQEPASYIGVPRLRSWLHLWLQLPSDAHPGKQQVIVSVTEFLQPAWKTWIEFPHPTLGLSQLWL